MRDLYTSITTLAEHPGVAANGKLRSSPSIQNNTLSSISADNVITREESNKVEVLEPEPGNSKPVPASVQALEKLRLILAESSIESAKRLIPTASNLRRLYMLCRVDPRLDATKERSALISLFGTLSLPMEIAALLETPHPLAAHMRQHSQRPRWSFVWLLIQDQRAAGGLRPEDLAWYFSALRTTNDDKKYSIVPPTLLSRAAALLKLPTAEAAYDYHQIYTRSTSLLRWSDRLDHSKLVCFFGTLALPTGVQTPHDHPAAARIRGEHHSDWIFVLTLLRDKWRVKELSAEDMYWLIVAKTRALGMEVEDIDTDLSLPLRDLRLRHGGAFLKELHEPGFGLASYIDGLWRLETESASNEAIAWFYALASRRTVLEPSVQRVLWRTVLRDTALFEAHQERLLRVVHSRIFEIKVSQALPAPASDNDYDDGVDTSFHKPPPLQAEDFLLRVSRHIFPTDSALDGQSPSQIVVQNWTRYLAQTMFDPKFAASARWMNLVYLAFANMPTADVPRAVSYIRLPGQDGVSLHPVDLRAIVLLTVFERLASTGQLQPQMGPIIERLWRSWAMSVREHITVHSALVRPLLASFFMLAGHLRDPALLSSMLDLSRDKSWIWAFDFGDDPAREQVRALVTAYVAASALCGRVVWEEIIAGVPSYAAFPQWVPSLLGAALARLARVEPVLAAELHARWGAHVNLPTQTLAPLALALVNAGKTELAIPLLPTCDYRHEEAISAFGAVLLPLSHAREPLDPATATLLSVALQSAVRVTSIPSHMRGRFVWLLFQLIQAERLLVDLAMHAMALIREKNPRFFETAQVGGLIRALLRRRYFKRALTVLEGSTGHYSRRAVSAWARMFIIASVRTSYRNFVATPKSSAPSLVDRAKVLITHPEVRRDPYAAVLVHGLDARGRWRRALVLSSRLHEHSPRGSPAFARAICVILAMRGERKLMTALRRLHPPFSQWERTAIGNILLRYWIGKRDRRVRSDGNVAATIETLKAALGFRPDRMTLNILLGRALRRSTCPTRALFDELIRRGYPAPNGPPFSIPWRERSQHVLSTLDGIRCKRMLFTKHVRPLYKTFIRALARRNDLEGMRIVVGALKYAQEQHSLQMRDRRTRRLWAKRGGR